MALAHAILVSLLDRPSSGYDLAKQFDGSVGCFWDASHQQIYRELAKLEAVGRIQAQSIQQNTRPNKIIYGITPQGEAWLKPWLAEPVTLAPVKDSLWVKLFGGHLVPLAVRDAELRRHQALPQVRLQEYAAIATQCFPHPDQLLRAPTYQYLIVA
ncbi:MAG: PadR family transcriptional regulator [Cyanobacteria bacterium]|nr:PadR family transcriptional regulator [Cyanobacteriota bacterium]